LKRPRYFCEHCGLEVRKNARVCPRCGRFFSSVKCPRCGYAGQAEDFDAGCPVCGYAEAANAAPDPIRPPPVAAPPPPRWSYALAALVLAALVFLLYQAVK
jgi:hypothetical protein